MAAEKKELVDEAKKIITTIRQMEASLEGHQQRRGDCQDDQEFKITYPLNRCLQGLREKHIQIGRLHKERFEQVKSRLSSQSCNTRISFPSFEFRLLTFFFFCRACRSSRVLLITS